MSSQQPKSSDIESCPRKPTLESLVTNGDIGAIRTVLANATQSRDTLKRALSEATKQRNAEIVGCFVNVGSLQLIDLGDACRHAAFYGDLKTVEYPLSVESFVTPYHVLNHPLLAAVDSWNKYKPKEGKTPPPYAKIDKLIMEAEIPMGSLVGVGWLRVLELGNLDVIRYLLQRVEDKKGLLDNPCSVISPNRSASLLWTAVFMGQPQIVRYLVEAGANPPVRCTVFGIAQLAIHAAFHPDRHNPRSGTVETIRYLISVDRNQLNNKTSEGRTCLHLAAELNNPEGIEYLISQKADCEAKCDNGETPWQTAVACRSVAAMGTFLRHDVEIFRDKIPLGAALTELVPGGSAIYPSGGKLLYVRDFFNHN